MLIFLIDDENAALTSTERAVRQASPDSEIHCFLRGQAALDAIADQGLRPNVVFSDIQMPGLDGLSLAIRLRELCPEARIIFVTGYNEYAVDAFRIHAHGYVMKPLQEDRVREELEHLQNVEPRPAPKDRLEIRCFGYFEVFWQNRPLHFQRQQTRELLAYLISRDGDACTNGEIAAALWEDEGDVRVANNRIRTLLSDLRWTLRRINMEELLIRHWGSIALDRSLVDCDYYRMLNGDVDAINSFDGQFMQQYSWAEMIAGALTFRHMA